MFLRLALLTTLLVLYPLDSDGIGGGTVYVPVPEPTPQKCSQCATANLIECGPNVGAFYGGVDNNADCVCGTDGLPTTQKACNPAACCESTAAQCCSDPASNSYECFGSNCRCNFGPDPGEDCKAPVTCCPAFVREETRRLKEVSDQVFTGDEAEFTNFADSCGSYYYNASLYVADSHFFAMATIQTQDQDTTSGCPSFFVVHSNFSTDNPAQKEMITWFDKATGWSYFPKESLPIGTFHGHDLAVAFVAADPSGSSGPYDYVTNNCADFMINLAKILEVKVDSTITTYIARRLLEDSGSALVERIRESGNYFSFLGNSDNRHLRGDDLTEDEVVQLVVEARAADVI